MKIETERLVIRDFQKRDVVGLLEYLSNPRVNCFAADRLCSEEAAFVYMQYSQKDMQRYAVSLKKEDFIYQNGKMVYFIRLKLICHMKC